MGRGKGDSKKLFLILGGRGGCGGWVESGDGYKILFYFNIFFL